MKKLLSATLLFLSNFIFSQAPNLINYQGVTRDNSGIPVAGTYTLTAEIRNAGLVYSENHIISTNAMGLFNIKIGGGNQIGPATFASIDWSTGPYNISISLFDGVSNVNMGTQQLVSVPYALYAKTSGNGSSPTYSPSSNISIIGNTLDITSTGVSSGSYGSVGPINSTVPNFSVDAKGRLISAGQYTANLNGDIGGTLDNQTVNKLKGNPLSNLTPTIGQVLQFDGTSWLPATVGVSGVTTVATSSPLSGGPITSGGTISLLPSGVTPGNYGNSPNTIPTFSVDALGRVMNAGTFTLASPGTTINTAAPLMGGPIINSGTVSLQPSGVVSGSYGFAPNTVPTFSVDAFGRLMSAGSYSLSVPTNSLNGDVKGTFLSNTVTALQNFSVSPNTPTVGQTLQFQAPGIWTPFTPPLVVQPWNKTGTTVTLTAPGDNVGIGAVSPNEKLQVESTGPTRVSILAPSVSQNALWFGTIANHSLGIIQYDNNSNEMNFGTNNSLNRIRLFANGNAAFGSTLAANPVSSFVNFCKQGANYTKVLISGGDNSNTYGGILSFGENETATQGMSIKMDAGANRLMFTNDINGTTPVVSIGGYSGSNNGMMVGTGYTGSNPPVNGMAVQGNVGIGTIAPSTPLHVNGTVRITDGTQGNNKVLSSDAAGNASWKQMEVGFKIEGTASQNVAASSYAIVAFDNPIFDDAAAFNLATETYVVPSTGLYSFTSAVYWPSFPGVRPYLEILVNGSIVQSSMIYCAPSSQLVQQVSTLVKVNAGDLVTTRVYNNSIATTLSGISGQQGTLFTGFKIY